MFMTAMLSFLVASQVKWIPLREGFQVGWNGGSGRSASSRDTATDNVVSHRQVPQSIDPTRRSKHRTVFIFSTKIQESGVMQERK